MLTNNWLIKNLDTIGSTQDYAKALNASNKQIAITTQNQTKGYGQYGRQWVGIEDNLCVSLVIPAENITADVALIASMAVGDVIFNHGVNVQYKWVNDILIGEKKVAGVLTEYFKGNLIIGIGINIKAHPENTDNFSATNLLEHGINISSDKFLDLMLKSFTQTYNKWSECGFKGFKMLWKTRAYKFNENVTITSGYDIISGTFIDIDDNGRAVIQTSNGLEYLQAGSLK